MLRSGPCVRLSLTLSTHSKSKCYAEYTSNLLLCCREADKPPLVEYPRTGDDCTKPDKVRKAHKPKGHMPNIRLSNIVMSCYLFHVSKSPLGHSL